MTKIDVKSDELQTNMVLTYSEFFNYVKVVRMLYGIAIAQELFDKNIEQLYDVNNHSKIVNIVKVN